MVLVKRYLTFIDDGIGNRDDMMDWYEAAHGTGRLLERANLLVAEQENEPNERQ